MSEMEKKEVAKTKRISKPILRKIDDSGTYAEITFIDGLNYSLKHPGNRTAAEWRSISITEKLTSIDLIEKSIEFVIKPIGHSKELNIDSMHPRELEVWAVVVQRFLSGKLEQEI